MKTYNVLVLKQMQDGFTYTGLLLDAIQHTPGYVVQQRVDNCGNEDISNNLQSHMELGNRKQSNEASSTTFEKQLDEDPWNLSMFDDIQLDQVKHKDAKIIIQKCIIQNIFRYLYKRA
jgi:hypothetical protein